MLAQCASIPGRNLLCVIDNQDVDSGFLRSQFEAELHMHRVERIWAIIRVQRWTFNNTPAGVAHRLFLSQSFERIDPRRPSSGNESSPKPG